MMTGDTTKNIKARALEEGIDSFLSKPFNFDTISEQADLMMH
jgi:DNA-binding response OmpR family regulator